MDSRSHSRITSTHEYWYSILLVDIQSGKLNDPPKMVHRSTKEARKQERREKRQAWLDGVKEKWHAWVEKIKEKWHAFLAKFKKEE